MPQRTALQRGIPLLLAITFLAAPRPTSATVFVAMSDADLTRASDVILTGTVTEIRSVATKGGRSIRTFVTLDVDQVLKGRLKRRTVTIREPGGEVGPIRQQIYGTPQYAIGEDVLVFLQRHKDGTLGTTNLGLGKYRISGRSVGIAERTLEAQVIGSPERDVRSLKAMTAEIRRHVMAAPVEFVDLVEVPPEALDDSLPHSVVSAYSFLGPGRWNEADSGQTISYLVDEAGEPAIGLAESIGAVRDAMAAWSNVPTARISLDVGGTTPARAMACDGLSQIVFNDPVADVPDPSGCSGILALGGFCANSSRKTTVNGVDFIAITEANITFNNGFSSCSFWNKSNITEILTHEIGHTIGLGHSSESSGEKNPVLSDATMYFRAHFDGRGAGLLQDDIDGVSFIYPGVGPEDGDGDGILEDGDGDGVPSNNLCTGGNTVNCDDNCPNESNPHQDDTDGDGHGDLCDNCPTISNPDQVTPAGCKTLYVKNFTVIRGKSANSDGLRLRGTFELPEGETIDPGSGLVTLLLVDRDGNLLREEVATAAVTAKKRRVRYRYLNESRSLRIHVNSRNGSDYKVLVSGKSLSLADADTAPVIAAVLMDSQTFGTKLTRCASLKRGRRFVCVP